MPDRNALNGLFHSLADMPEARVETRETVRFDVKVIRQAMELIRSLRGTGQLVINFANGKPNGLAEWKS